MAVLLSLYSEPECFYGEVVLAMMMTIINIHTYKSCDYRECSCCPLIFSITSTETSRYMSDGVNRKSF